MGINPMIESRNMRKEAFRRFLTSIIDTETSVSKAVAIFSLKTGLRSAKIREYLNELTEAEVIFLNEEGFVIKKETANKPKKK